MELKTIAANFIPGADIEVPPDEQTRSRWRRRYAAGVDRLQRAGIKTDESGTEAYISLRTEWDRYITELAPKFAYHLEEIDPAMTKVKQE